MQNNIQPHVCDKEDKIRKLEVDLAVAQSDIKNVKDDIKDVKQDMKETRAIVKDIDRKIEKNNEKIDIKFANIDRKFDKQLWWMIGLLVTMVGGMAAIIYQNLAG